jgi:hypothetical protein
MSAVEKRMPQTCPSCDSKMKVKKLVCPACSTEIDGLFNFPVLSMLSNDDQFFIIDFIKGGGSLKDMATKMKLSYPTVRNHLDEIISKINSLEKK